MTYKKKLKMKNRRRFSIFLVMTVALMVVFFTIVSSGVTEEPEKSIEIHIVAVGDTLWEIARESCPRGDIRDYIDQLCDLNHIQNAIIIPGQVLELP